MIITKQGYLSRRVTGSPRKVKNYYPSYRDWWLVKWNSSGSSGVVQMNSVTLPKEFVGKKVRFKIEVYEDREEKGSV